MQLFKSPASAQRFLTTHAGVYNTFYTQRHLISRATPRTFRSAANDAWIEATVAARDGFVWHQLRAAELS
jgi:hypothetical protein